MVICAIVGCGNRSVRDRGTSFYRLPSIINHQGAKTESLSRKRRDAWLAKIRREDIVPEQYYNIRVCSDHFIKGSPSNLYDETNPDWVPSLKLGFEYDDCSQCSRSERYERAVKRRRTAMCSEESTEMVGTVEEEWEGDEDDCVDNTNPAELQRFDMSTVTRNEVAVQTEQMLECPGQLSMQIEELKKENDHLKLVNHHLELKLKGQTLQEDNFRDDDKKVLYYTGLCKWELFVALFMYIKPYLQVTGKSSLSPFQDLELIDSNEVSSKSTTIVGYRFQIHHTTASRIFVRVLDLLFVKLKPLIRWPDRDALRKTMPMVFRKHFPKCVVIIDCFEIFLDRPTHLLARAQTYSSYKHHNTVKYLIGITPQGTVSFISDGWGGRTSDKYLTEHSTLLDNLVPGDTVLADRGFDIKDSVGLMLSQLEILAFTKNKTQLDPISIEQTRNIANVRIHVERVIGNVRKKYSILGDTQPIDFVTSVNGDATTLDKIVLTSCALINICDSVVPFE